MYNQKSTNLAKQDSDDIWDYESDLQTTVPYDTYSSQNNRTNYNGGQPQSGSGSYNRDSASFNWRQDEPQSGRGYNNRNSSSSNWRQDEPQSERGSYNRNSSSSNWRQDDSSEIQIESSKVGKVIGQGGSKIRELQQDSGARINVVKDSDSDGLTTVRLVGSSDAREKAKNMIEELTKDRFRESAAEKSLSTDSPAVYMKDGEMFYDWDMLNKLSDEFREKRLAALPKLIKEFYHEDPVVASMSKSEVAKFRRENNNISVNKVDPDDDRPILNPVSTFSQVFGPYPELLQELKKQKFVNPSPIQSQAWPFLMSGYDLIGIAQTGTGKTIAFLFPALIHIVKQPTPRSERPGPTVLIFSPTRELAQQIEEETKKYSYHNIKSACIYGGGSRKDQINLVSKGVDIVIATPGRLNDLVQNKFLDVTGVSYLVLDEADRMLDMGFEPQIHKTVLDIRPDRQTVMTSATWNREIEDLAQRYMTKPFKINVGDLDLAAVESVTQEVVLIEDENRRIFLQEFIEAMGPDDKAIVFCERKAVVDDISSDFQLRGMNLQSIHGGREQEDREQALDDLKTGYVKVLIATDVASRGLDVKDITHVVNLYFPHNIEEYVHRVGRTGRAGRTGTAISLFTREDWAYAEEFIKILEKGSQYVPKELYEMADRYRAWRQRKDLEDAEGRGRMGGRGGRRGGFRRRF